MTLRLDDNFHVRETFDIRDKDGNIVSRFQPGFSYKVTKRNMPEVLEAEIGGIVIAGRDPGDRDPGVAMNQTANVQGSVTVEE